MHTYDVTLTISPDMPVWPGDPSVDLKLVSKISDGASANVSHIKMGVHTGTHVDAPFHFLDNGKTIEEIPLSILVGRAYVLHLPNSVRMITAEILQNANIPPRTRRVLMRTRNSILWGKKNLSFQEDFVAIDEEASEYLVNRGVKLVGVDYLSVAPFKNSGPTHRILLSAGVVIVEGLDLSKVSQGRYNFHCLPLKLAGSDGAPARVILTGV
jgi:arylformamidase